MQTYTGGLISGLTLQRKSHPRRLGPLFWYFLKVLQKYTENAVRIAKSRLEMESKLSNESQKRDYLRQVAL